MFSSKFKFKRIIVFIVKKLIWKTKAQSNLILPTRTREMKIIPNIWKFKWLPRANLASNFFLTFTVNYLPSFSRLKMALKILPKNISFRLVGWKSSKLHTLSLEMRTFSIPYPIKKVEFREFLISPMMDPHQKSDHQALMKMKVQNSPFLMETSALCKRNKKTLWRRLRIKWRTWTLSQLD